MRRRWSLGARARGGALGGLLAVAVVGASPRALGSGARPAPAAASGPVAPAPAVGRDGASASRADPAAPGSGRGPADERASILFLGGVALALGGSASVIGGLLYTTAGPGDYCPECPATADTALGYAALIGGFSAVAVGGVLVVLGSRPDPRDEGTPEPRLALAVGPGGATLQGSF